jgi:hypothetical protein
LEVKSENGVLKNQQLARINFPVFGDLRQSPVLYRIGVNQIPIAIEAMRGGASWRWQ